MISAIIVAAGSSRRMGFDKLAADLRGRSVLARSIEAFDRCERVSEIIVVTTAEKVGWAEQLATGGKAVRVIEGGAERHLSVWKGIGESSPDFPLVAVHDGARPLVRPETIAECARMAEERGGATLAHRVVDTLKRARPGELTVAESVSRDDLWGMETPQIFRREILVPAYESILEKGATVTDEVSAVQAAGHEVYLVENPFPNPKITVPSDLELAGALLRSEA